MDTVNVNKKSLTSSATSLPVNEEANNSNEGTNSQLANSAYLAATTELGRPRPVVTCQPNEQSANSLIRSITATDTTTSGGDNSNISDHTYGRPSSISMQDEHNRSSGSQADLAAIQAIPTNISLPPEYNRIDELEKQQRQARYDSLHMARLEAFYRANPGTVIYEYFNRNNPAANHNPLLASFVASSGSHRPTVSLRNALNACLLFQFLGFPTTFWLLLLGFIGCLSFIVEEVPNLYLLLWIPLVLYGAGVAFVQWKQKGWLARLEDLESQVRDERSRTIMGHTTTAVDNSIRAVNETLTKDKYNNHFFIIMEDANHSHSVITLLPPPPAYLKAGDQ